MLWTNDSTWRRVGRLLGGTKVARCPWWLAFFPNFTRCIGSRSRGRPWPSRWPKETSCFIAAPMPWTVPGASPLARVALNTALLCSVVHSCSFNRPISGRMCRRKSFSTRSTYLVERPSSARSFSSADASSATDTEADLRLQGDCNRDRSWSSQRSRSSKRASAVARSASPSSSHSPVDGSLNLMRKRGFVEVGAYIFICHDLRPSPVRSFPVLTGPFIPSAPLFLRGNSTFRSQQRLFDRVVRSDPSFDRLSAPSTQRANARGKAGRLDKLVGGRSADLEMTSQIFDGEDVVVAVLKLRHDFYRVPGVTKCKEEGEEISRNSSFSLHRLRFPSQNL